MLISRLSEMQGILERVYLIDFRTFLFPDSGLGELSSWSGFKV